MPNRRSILTGTAAIATACLLPARGHAQAEPAFPSRTIRVVVPYGPGGATDIVTRVVTEEMRRILGQSLIVENRPGGLGIPAIDVTARSRPDGYTLMVGNVTTNAITPVVFSKRMPLDYESSMIAVARLAELPGVLCATRVNFPPTTVTEVIEHARKHPGAVNYVTAGVASYTHFDTVLLGRRGGVEMTHIPFTSGAGGFIAGLVAGDVQIGFVNAATATPLVKGGQLRGLAVVAPQRLPDLPDVPTMAQAGYEGIGTPGWNAMFGPAGLPPEVTRILHRAAIEAIASPGVQEAFRRQGILSIPSASPEDAQGWLKSELAAWRRIAAEANIDVS